MQPVNLNERGTSLIEILVSLFLVAIIFSGLIQSSILVANRNIENALRDEAVSIADDTLAVARNAPYDTLVTTAPTATTRNFRNIAGFRFDTSMTVNILDADNNNKRLMSGVTWTWKGTGYNHSVSTVVRRP